MTFGFGEFELNERLCELRRAGEPVAVQPKVLALISYLVRHHDRVVPKSELFVELWPGHAVGETSLTRAVRAARLALGDSGDSQAVIRNVRGHGYRFVLPLRECSEPALARAPRANAELVEPERRSSPPLHSGDEPFVGRARVMRMLENSLGDALAGRGRMALLVGEPGIGKTRTASELARIANRRGALSLFGRCVEGEGAPPYWAWVSVLRQCFAALGDDDRRLAELMGPGAEDIVQAMPELKPWLFGLPPPPAIASIEARFRLFDSVVRFVRRLSEQRPLLIVLDDLHRADQPTLLLLRFLSREIGNARLMVIGTYRSPESGGDSQVAKVLSELARLDPSRCVTLEGLEREELSRLLELALGRVAPQPIVDALHEQTAGNPLFCSQVLSMWLASGEELPEQITMLPAYVTRAHGLREAIERRLEMLPESCRSLLTVAAVIGRDFSLGLLAATTGIAPLRVLERLSEALSSGVIRAVADNVGQYRFVHGLMPDALYAQLAAPEAAKLHHRVASALEASSVESDAHINALAHHALRGAPAADPDRAVDYCLRAAQRAADRLAHEEAAQFCDRALHALALRPATDAQTLAILTDKAEALYLSSDKSGSRSAFERVAAVARATGSAEWLARAAWGIGLTAESGQPDLGRIALLEEAIAALPSHHVMRPALQAFLAKALLYADDRERRIALARSAVTAARALGDQRTRGFALCYSHRALGEPQYLAERCELSREIVQLTTARRNDEILVDAYSARVQDFVELGDMQGVDAAIAAMSALAEEVRQPKLRWFGHAYASMRAMMRGDFEEAEERSRCGLEAGRVVDERGALQVYAVQMLAGRYVQGRTKEAVELVKRAASFSPDAVAWQIVELGIDAALGDPEDARLRLTRLLQGLSALRRDPFVLGTLPGLAALCFEVGDEAQCAVLYEELHPFSECLATSRYGFVVHGPVVYFLGLLAERMNRDELALAHYEAAVTRSELIGARPYLALACYRLGRLLHACGRASDLERSDEAIARARSIARRCGMPILVRECEATLEKARPRGRPVSQPILLAVNAPQRKSG